MSHKTWYINVATRSAEAKSEAGLTLDKQVLENMLIKT